ncbi:MAG: hypothetical protein IPP90_23490 [Gemmatimonadaceae bacterium]|nr:hypothetical protein [Gemmatimonadaceae bacterium]
MAVKPNALFPGTFTARVVVRDDGSLTLRFVDVTITVSSAGAIVTANGAGRRFGPLPIITYALADNQTGTDIYPLAPVSGFGFLFALFDTGTGVVYLNSERPYDIVVPPYTDPNGGLRCQLPNRITDGNFFGSDAGILNVTGPVTARYDSTD